MDWCDDHKDRHDCFGMRRGTFIREQWYVSTIGDFWVHGISEQMEVGYGRKYETMVFRVAGVEDCGCPKIEFANLDFWGGNDRAAAEASHVAMCAKWEAIRVAP